MSAFTFGGDHGLTPFGEEVVREMEALGMIVDVSHVHERTFWDVVRLAKIAGENFLRVLAENDR